MVKSNRDEAAEVLELQAWIVRIIRARLAEQPTGQRSVSWLSRSSGIPDKTLRRILDCERPAPLERLAQLAHVFGMTLSDLVSTAETAMTQAPDHVRRIVSIQGTTSLSGAQKAALIGDVSPQTSDVASFSEHETG